jgi:hypothetical protein
MRLPPTAALHGAVSVVDSVISLTPLRSSSGVGIGESDGVGKGDVPCVVANGSVYLSDVFVSGCRIAVAPGGGRASVLMPAGATTAHVPLLGLGRLVADTASGSHGSARRAVDTNLAHSSAYPGNSSASPAGHTLESTLANARIDEHTPPMPPYRYAFPSYVNGARSLSGVASIVAAPSGAPPDLTSQHWLGPDGGATWQTEGAVSALDVGCVGDGVTNDGPALQRAVDAHDVVVLPKGFYRIDRPLLMRRPGAALVGVGRTLSFLMPVSDAAGFGEHPVIDVSADGVTICALAVVAWDHVPLTYAVRWAGSSGVWRQSFFNRVTGELGSMNQPASSHIFRFHPLTCSLTSLLTHTFSLSLPYPVNHPPTCTHTPTHMPTHLHRSLTHSLTHTHTHSLTLTPTHVLCRGDVPAILRTVQPSKTPGTPTQRHALQPPSVRHHWRWRILRL